VLVLAGSRAQLDDYDELFCIYKPTLGARGDHRRRTRRTRHGQGAGAEGIDFRIVERLPERIRAPEKYVLGDAAELEVLQRAGIMEASAVVVTTHDDDMNVYLTIYCRKLRPDIQILGRANVERNISTLHRAGADFVLSYASIGANILFNLLKRIDTLLLAEGLNVFPVADSAGHGGPLAGAMQGAEKPPGATSLPCCATAKPTSTPTAHEPLPADAELIVIGDATAEQRFVEPVRKRR
jgi:voltage-gated potassium channel